MSQKRNITWNFEQNINWLQQKSKSRHCHTRATGEPDSQLEDPLEYLDLTGEFTFIGTGIYLYGDQSRIATFLVDNNTTTTTDLIGESPIAFKDELPWQSHTATVGLECVTSIADVRDVITRIEIASLIETPNIPSPKIMNLYPRQENPTRRISLPAIIGVAVGVFVLLAVGLGVIAFFWIKSIRAEKRDFPDGRPPDYSSREGTTTSSLGFANPRAQPSLYTVQSPRVPYSPDRTRVSFANRDSTRPPVRHPSHDSLGRSVSQGAPFAPRQRYPSNAVPMAPFASLASTSHSPPGTSHSAIGIGSLSSPHDSPQVSIAPYARSEEAHGTPVSTSTTLVPVGKVGESSRTEPVASTSQQPMRQISRLSSPPRESTEFVAEDALLGLLSDNDPTSAERPHTFGLLVDNEPVSAGRPPTYRSSETHYVLPHYAGGDGTDISLQKWLPRGAVPLQAENNSEAPHAPLPNNSVPPINLTSVDAPATSPTQSLRSGEISVLPAPVDPNQARSPSNPSTNLPSPPSSRPGSRGISTNPAVLSPIKSPSVSGSVEPIRPLSQQTSLHSHPRPLPEPESPHSADMKTAEEGTDAPNGMSSTAFLISDPHSEEVEGRPSTANSGRQSRNGKVWESGWF